MAAENEKITIGWREWVALPDLNIPAIKVKIDTGARTSALHAFDLEVFERDGRQKVRFGIHPLQRKTRIVRYCVADVQEKRMVTDSGGHCENRYVIRTTLSLADKLWPIEVTLSRRDTMRYRMLLGRTALQGWLIIDPAKSYLAGRALSRSYKKDTLERRKL